MAALPWCCRAFAENRYTSPHVGGRLRCFALAHPPSSSACSSRRSGRKNSPHRATLSAQCASVWAALDVIMFCVCGGLGCHVLEHATANISQQRIRSALAPSSTAEKGDGCQEAAAARPLGCHRAICGTVSSHSDCALRRWCPGWTVDTSGIASASIHREHDVWRLKFNSLLSYAYAPACCQFGLCMWHVVHALLPPAQRALIPWQSRTRYHNLCAARTGVRVHGPGVRSHLNSAGCAAETKSCVRLEKQPGSQ